MIPNFSTRKSVIEFKEDTILEYDKEDEPKDDFNEG